MYEQENSKSRPGDEGGGGIDDLQPAPLCVKAFTATFDVRFAGRKDRLKLGRVGGEGLMTEV